MDFERNWFYWRKFTLVVGVKYLLCFLNYISILLSTKIFKVSALKQNIKLSVY